MYRILIADDHPDITDMWALFLGELGHEVHIATDGVAALELARAVRPQRVLRDIGLPGLSGLEIAKGWRQEFTRRQMVLVASTGRATESARRESLQAGFDYHLNKPVGFESLEQLLSRPDLL